MNQNIVQGTQHGTRHSQRKTDVLTRRQLPVHLKEHPAGGDIARHRRDLPITG